MPTFNYHLPTSPTIQQHLEVGWKAQKSIGKALNNS